ncbi:MAG TPA: GNAT family N-acetyltransferase [Spirochaetia bacterium]|nr:GNAT family N-acetyltransferase [Spirochaetia bacterium]
MKCNFEARAPVLFPDGGVFLATAKLSLDGETTTWHIPGEFESKLRPVVSSIPSDRCLDVDFLAVLSMELDSLLGLNRGTLTWRVAAGYSYVEKTLPQLPAIEVYSNRYNTLPAGTKRDKFSWWYITHKFATCRIEGKEVVTICFTDNGAITVDSKDEFRQRGFGTACLKRITAELVKEGLRPGFGTAYDNTPARKTAEAAGFTLTEYLYWVEVTAEQRWNLPASFNRKLDTAT